MTIVPIRDLGKTGVNTDWSPFDLPITTFTMGNNVRFVNNHIRRGPICTTVGPIAKTDPKFSFGIKMLNTSARLLVCHTDGSIYEFRDTGAGKSPIEINLSPSGFTPNIIESTYTGTINNDVVYINREDRVPWFCRTNGDTFAELTNWNTYWRCKSLRSFKGVLVALNMTENGVNYPNKIRTSEFSTFGNVPTTWTPSPTGSATFNTLGNLYEPLVDGLLLRDRMMLYSANETWAMDYTGDFNMFTYQRLFASKGMISQNCVAESNNRHFVFGTDDIWMHDGYTHQSISLGRVRDFIYSNMIRGQADKFFVFNNARQGEVMFCYVSKDSYCRFPSQDDTGNYRGCNRAAVYNYNYDTWYFYDLPYATSASFIVPYTGETYDSIASSVNFDTYNTTYNSLIDDTRACVSLVSRQGVVNGVGTISSGVRIFEANNVASGNGLLDSVATAPVFLENKQMDMDDLSSELRGYKVVNQMWPEAHFEYNAPAMSFTWGSSDSSNVDPVYDHTMTFDGKTLNKLDFNAPGKYLSLKMEYTGIQDFSLSGFDIDYQVFGHR